MVHAGEGKLEGVIAKISTHAGISDYQVLLSEEEFKKKQHGVFLGDRLRQQAEELSFSLLPLACRLSPFIKEPT